MSRRTTLSLLLFPVAALLAALWFHHKVEPPRPDGAARELERALDQDARAALDAWHAPGLALAVVRGDQVLYLQGHGVRQAGRPDPVTGDTVFPLGSCSKAFTSTALASLVAEGVVGWDDPVCRHLAWFHLSDPRADREATLRDLLCHRTGLASHNLLWYRAPWPPDEVVRRARFLPFDKPFRSAFQYQSTMVTAAGLAAAASAKSPWEDLVRRRLLEPLGMSATALTTPEALERPDHAEPHRLDGAGKPASIPRYVMNLPDPAGSVHSSARDLAQWLLFHLHEGKKDGRVVVPAGPLADTHAPQIQLHPSQDELELFPDTRAFHYALAWVVYDLAGRKALTHSGAIDGFSTQLTFLPEEQVGVVVLSNLDQTQLNRALTRTVLDRLLNLPNRDWNHLFKTCLNLDAGVRRAKETARWAAREPGPLRHPEGDYAGDYEHPAYGRTSVTVAEGGGLRWRWRDFEGPLTHFEGDTFRLDVEPVGPAKVAFVAGEQGRVEGMRVKGPHLDVEFVRGRE